ncbi:LOW QUALITY PROTEIN: carotenoid oxygenase [Copromyces sp. CBS 386.78]|nr:LOW QUALITY PROTEIN: carotenoid oxygenase [Copromyces sp. CBS 386.78]
MTTLTKGSETLLDLTSTSFLSSYCGVQSSSIGDARLKSSPRYTLIQTPLPHRQLPSERVQWFETNPCCIFHAANCWDTGSQEQDLNTRESEVLTTTVNLLVCRMTSASLIFNAGNLPTPVPRIPIPPEHHEEELYYYSFSLTPRSHPRYIYGCTTTSPSASSTSTLGKSVKIDALTKLDVTRLIARGTVPDNPSPPEPIKGCVDTRSVSGILAPLSCSSSEEEDPIKIFTFPPNHYAQEARFVPRHNGVAEDDGWLLTYVFDESQIDEESGECGQGAKSELWVIDAKGMKEVAARIRLPQRVPYGFHGTWFSEEEGSEGAFW